MPMVPNAKPNVDSMLERIWGGSRALCELHVDPQRQNVKIVLSEEARAAIMTQKSSIKWRGAIQLYFEANEPPTISIFGVPVEIDSRLMPSEIRFRSEVVI